MQTTPNNIDSHRRVPGGFANCLAVAALAGGFVSCSPPDTKLSPPPEQLHADGFYRKHLDADGIPIMSNQWVDDGALHEAKRLLKEAIPSELHQRLISVHLRVVLFNEADGINRLPEYRTEKFDQNLCGYSDGARFLVSVNANTLLCRTGSCDVGSTFLHELGHAVRWVIDDSKSWDIEYAYKNAMSAGLWGKSYGKRNSDEYWAEGVQIWFDAKPNSLGDGINTRDELKKYDLELAALLERVWGDGPWKYTCPVNER